MTSPANNNTSLVTPPPAWMEPLEATDEETNQVAQKREKPRSSQVFTWSAVARDRSAQQAGISPRAHLEYISQKGNWEDNGYRGVVLLARASLRNQVASARLEATDEKTNQVVAKRDRVAPQPRCFEFSARHLSESREAGKNLSFYFPAEVSVVDWLSQKGKPDGNGGGVVLLARADLRNQVAHFLANASEK